MDLSGRGSPLVKEGCSYSRGHYFGAIYFGRNDSFAERSSISWDLSSGWCLSTFLFTSLGQSPVSKGEDRVKKAKFRGWTIPGPQLRPFGQYVKIAEWELYMDEDPQSGWVSHRKSTGVAISEYERIFLGVYQNVLDTKKTQGVPW